MENKPTELPTLIEDCARIIEDGQYELKNARSPKRVRTIQASIHFFKSVLVYLKRVQDNGENG